jgi:putative DNA primase/helicase
MSIAQSKQGASDRIAKEVAAMATAGLRVVRVWGVARPGVCRCPKGATCASPGKHPVGNDWLNKSSTTDEETIFEWWADGANNVGIALGPDAAGTGPAVIDVEYDVTEGAETITRLGLDRVETPTYKSPRSVHRLFRWSPALPDVQKREIAGLEVRIGGGGAQTHSAAPPSTHTSGVQYSWLEGFSLADVDISEIPPALLDLICAPPGGAAGIAATAAATATGNRTSADQRRLDAMEILAADTIPDGSRNDSLFTVALAQAYAGASIDEIVANLRQFNARACKPPLRLKEVDDIAKSAKRRAKNERRQEQDAREARVFDGGATPGPANVSTPATWTHNGLARRIVREARGTIGFAPGDGLYVFDGTRWLRDVDGSRAQSIAKRVADELIAEVATLPFDERKAAMAFAKDASRKNTINAAIELARSEPEIAIDTTAMNADRYLLNVRNGTIELESRTFREHRAGDFITEIAGVAYDPSADCPRFLRFMDEITGHDAELVGFLQRSIGYALSGDVEDHALWMHTGEGSNGKSQLLKIVGSLLGTYAGTAPQSFLLHTKNSGGDEAKRYSFLRGKRFVVIPEQGDSAAEGRFNASVVKMLTGGDEVAVWELYRGQSVIKPTHKLHAVCNKKPRTTETNYALWRRLRVIAYEQQFIEGVNAERGLGDTLIRTELPGILNWALEGFAAWHRNGLGAPPAVTDATEEYRKDSDTIGKWIEESCVIGPTFTAASKELFESYRRWCKDHEADPESDHALGRDLSRRGIGTERRNGATVRRGIGLRDDRREGEA